MKKKPSFHPVASGLSAVLPNSSKPLGGRIEGRKPDAAQLERMRLREAGLLNAPIRRKRKGLLGPNESWLALWPTLRRAKK